MINLLNKKILLVICGGISAYKSLEIIRNFKKNKAQVKTILTKSAKEFITPLSVASLSQEKVYDDIFNVDEEKIRLGREINTLDDEIMRIDKKLENKNFTSKAPPKIIKEQKDKREGYKSSRAKLQDALSRL